MHVIDSIDLHKLLTEKGLQVTQDPHKNAIKIKCDAVIVGSGCGGGVAAATLASSGLKVVVLEKGSYFGPADYSPFEGPSMEKLYELGGSLPSIDGQFAILAGSTVGGGSAVNWSACIKTPESVLKEWTDECKIPVFGSNEYVSAMDIVSCKAEKFMLEQNTTMISTRKMKCTGVIATTFNKNITKKLQIEAKVTISACGALHTPLLMYSSGLKNPNIGRNLRLHPVLMSWGYFPDSDSDIEGKAVDGGIITSVHKVLGPNNNVQAIIETPSLGPGQYTALCPWVSGLDFKQRMLKFSRTAHLITIVKDRGSGEVHMGGRVTYKFDATDRENLRAGLRRSLRVLVAAGAVEVGTHRSDGQKLKCKGVSKEELEEFLDTVFSVGGPLFGGDKWMVHTTAHQMGSCKMGRNEKDGGVDENGESWEAEGLYVCDAKNSS
ncbi:hypothetical protein GOBAR_AA39535 [Gossypium barbadense]|uniref:Glucose-methanol-choline oxidoreductase N-terminal domain-containing protein n=1 Tax=Gossypium barbadense TaxID=3634 RepID=A0A2P5VQQ1_GOSBA|nr:hypothetical protein GOBAR_AA39535 [Gossypium barbadense]